MPFEPTCTRKSWRATKACLSLEIWKLFARKWPLPFRIQIRRRFHSQLFLKSSRKEVVQEMGRPTVVSVLQTAPEVLKTGPAEVQAVLALEAETVVAAAQAVKMVARAAEAAQVEKVEEEAVVEVAVPVAVSPAATVAQVVAVAAAAQAAAKAAVETTVAKKVANGMETMVVVTDLRVAQALARVAVQTMTKIDFKRLPKTWTAG
jgi:hypothetical protein